MTAAPDISLLARTVRSHDESLRAVGDTMIDIKGVVDRHTVALSGIRRTLTRHDRALHRLHVRTVRVEARLDAVEQRLDAVEQRLGAVEQRLGAVEQRLDAVEQRLGPVHDMLVEVLRRLPEPA